MTLIYKTDLNWKPNSNEALITSGERSELSIQPPTAFGGDDRAWTPEDLALAAAQSCLMLTLLYTTRELGVKMLRCSSHAEAKMDVTKEGPRFTTAIHEMDIWIAKESDREKLQKAVDDAVKGHPVNTISNISFEFRFNIHVEQKK